MCMCTRTVCVSITSPDISVRELGHLPPDDSERHSAALNGGGWPEDKKGGGGEGREEVSV